MERELAPGRTVWVKLPYGEFTVDPSRDAVLFAGGTGVTAFTAFLGWLPASGAHRVALFYGARTPDLFVYGDFARAGARGGRARRAPGVRGDRGAALGGCGVADDRDARHPVIYLSRPAGDAGGADGAARERWHGRGRHQDGRMGVKAVAPPRAGPRRSLEHVGERSGGPARRALFITGGTGFVGRWLIESLLAANDRFGLGVRAVVLSQGSRSIRSAIAASGRQHGWTYWRATSARSLPRGRFRPCPSPRRRDQHAADGPRSRGLPRCHRSAEHAGSWHSPTTPVPTSLLLVSSGAVYGRPAGGEPLRRRTTTAARPDPALAAHTVRPSGSPSSSPAIARDGRGRQPDRPLFRLRRPLPARSTPGSPSATSSATRLTPARSSFAVTARRGGATSTPPTWPAWLWTIAVCRRIGAAVQRRL